MKFLFIADKPINNIIYDKHAVSSTHFKAETTLCFPSIIFLEKVTNYTCCLTEPNEQLALLAKLKTNLGLT